MKKLIIITGISGTGKTTLAKNLNIKMEDSILLSYDELSEKISDIIGFKNKEQKDHLYNLKLKIYKELIEECMQREDEVIILEKPFKIEWKDYFESLIVKYKYDVFTINVFAKDFETIWQRLIKREVRKEERHPAHYLDSYYHNKKDTYTPFFEYNYNSSKYNYDKFLYNSLNIGKVINVNDIEEVDIDNLIKEFNK